MGGDDVVSKLHYGNFTFYSKAIVTNPRNVIIARNIFVQGYVGGNDCTFIQDEADASGNINGSLIAVPLPYGDATNLPNPLDITGFFNNGLEDGINAGKPHFAMGAAVAEKFNLRPIQKDLSTHDDIFRTQGRDVNTVCYQGHQFSY